MRPSLYALPLAALLLAGAAPGRANELQNYLFSKAAAPVRLKDMEPETWRHVVLGTGDKADDGPGGMTGLMGGILGGLMGGMFGGGANGLAAPAPRPSYTQGLTVTFGGETFLIVYQPPRDKGLDMAALMRAKDPSSVKLPLPEKLTAETLLGPSLINVRTIRSFTDVQPFNLDRELADEARRAASEAALREELNKRGEGEAPAPGDGADLHVAPSVEPAPARAAPAKKRVTARPRTAPRR